MEVGKHVLLTESGESWARRSQESAFLQPRPGRGVSQMCLSRRKSPALAAAPGWPGSPGRPSCSLGAVPSATSLNPSISLLAPPQGSGLPVAQGPFQSKQKPRPSELCLPQAPVPSGKLPEPQPLGTQFQSPASATAPTMPPLGTRGAPLPAGVGRAWVTRTDV